MSTKAFELDFAVMFHDLAQDPLPLHHYHSLYVIRSNIFLTQHVINLRNSLTQDVVKGPELDVLTKGLNTFMKEKLITGYKP